MNSPASRIVGGYASNICLATTSAARYELPYVVDVGVPTVSLPAA
jgi:hypothetical protein